MSSSSSSSSKKQGQQELNKDGSSSSNSNSVGEEVVTEKTSLIQKVKQSRAVIMDRSLKNSSSTHYDDKDEDITLTRKIVRTLSQFSWYCPPHMRNALDDAWAYFEHSTLPRYHSSSSSSPHSHHHHNDDENDKDNDNPGVTSSIIKDQFPKAEPGEKEHPTKLYPVIGTPETELADFGVGVAVYFFTLRALSIVMLIAGLLSLPNIYYFWSDDYNYTPEFTLSAILATSAVCTDKSWQACPTCTRSDWDTFPVTYASYAEATLMSTTTTNGTGEGYDDDNDQSHQRFAFILVSNCQISRWAGVVSFGVMLVVCLSVYVVSYISRRKEVVFDEAQQTPSDYSIDIRNPPLDAKDAEEWRTFLSQFGHVTSLTIAYDNEDLMRNLLHRRALILNLEAIQPVGVHVSPHDLNPAYETALPVPWYWKLYGTYDGPMIQERIASIDALIESDLSQRTYHVSEVFAVFETEEAQQAALKALQVPGFQVLRNDVAARPESNVFRGKHVLDVCEAPEPSSVRWEDLDEDWFVIIKQQIVTTTVTIIMIILGCFFVIYFRHFYGTVYAALAVTAVNSAAPYICYYIVLYGESHSNEGGRQASLYFKITGFLWITTALLTALITPFVETLDNNADSLIPAMYAIFITEMLKGPATQLSDVMGHLKRHYLAPRSRDPKSMSQYFRGTTYSLSERYTDLTNVLFLTFYYSMLFPAAYFFASATLAVHYWVDKFCLLRVWAPAPAIGNNVAEMSRTFFFSAAVVVYAIMSSYNFASFPYDDACGGTTSAPAEYLGGKFLAVTGGNTPVEIELDQDAKSYYYCNQDMVHLEPFKFPAVPSNQPPGFEWMSEEQDFAYVYGYTCVGIIACIALAILNKIRIKVMGFFWSPFERHCKTISLSSFSKIPDIGAYIPEANVPTDPFPILFCDVRGIDLELISWVDPSHPGFECHNAIFDLPSLTDKPVFSTVHHWKP